MSRLKILVGVAVLVCGILVWRWIAGWGLVTVNFVEAPLGKVIAAVERQGGLRVATNADLARPVTLQVRRTPVFDALETLAVRIDGQMNLTYLIAPDKRRLAEGLAAFRSTTNPEGWELFRSGWGGGGMMAGETVPDLRRISVTPSRVEDLGLHAMLDQVAQKSGLLFVAPIDWNPPLRALPKAGAASQVARRIASAAGGQVREVVLLSVRPERPEGDQDSQAARGRRDGGGRGAGGGSGTSTARSNNPEWAAERAEAQIALLPPEEREEAQQDYTQMRELWRGIRELPEDERRAKMAEIMSRPEVQDRMEERRLRRDMRRSPEQRTNRYQRYVNRKKAAQQSGQ